LIHMTWTWRPHRSQPPEPLVIDSLARQPIMSVGPVTLDAGARRVLINGWCVHLPAQETVLLQALMRQPGRAIPTRDLAACLAAFGPHDAERALRRTKRLTRCLSRRLTVHPLTPTLIEYVENVGFRFTVVAPPDGERSRSGRPYRGHGLGVGKRRDQRPNSWF
jgi:DNA-binding response OmpR family regulator